MLVRIHLAVRIHRNKQIKITPKTRHKCTSLMHKNRPEMRKARLVRYLHCQRPRLL